MIPCYTPQCGEPVPLLKCHSRAAVFLGGGVPKRSFGLSLGWVKNRPRIRRIEVPAIHQSVDLVKFRPFFKWPFLGQTQGVPAIRSEVPAIQ